MTHTYSSHLLTAALFGLALVSPTRAAWAEAPPVYFVGVQRGCERDGQLDHAIERRMFHRKTPVALVRKPTGEPLPPCFGDRCGQSFHSSCPTVPGRVLGGSVVQGKDLLQVRLWLYDLQTGQTAYQDEYCQGCDIVNALSTQAARLIASPSFGPAPGAAPAYCTATAAQSAGAAPVPAGPLLLTVTGEGKHKPALLSALKQYLALLGYKVDTLPIDSGRNTPDLKKLVAGQRNARVLGLEVPKEGKLQLFLYDQKTEQTEGKLLECEDCDKDALIAKVQPEVAKVMEHCFGDACVASSPAAAPPPQEACAPFPDPVCGGNAATAGNAALTGNYIDPATAKMIKGGLWGTFAASAATALGLTIANYTSAGTSTGPSDHTTNILGPAAIGAAGLSIISLAVAIPLTVHVRRAESSSQHATGQAGNSPTLQCPQ